MKRCLYCYQELAKEEIDFHLRCSKKFFELPEPPKLGYTESQMEELATQVIRSSATIPGVQPKISLDIQTTHRNEPKRFTIVGLWGHYILKPPSIRYPELPEIEDLTMHLAEIAKIKVVPHSLIRLQSGNLAYITKRIDRKNSKKIHMEDMCQLTNRPTSEKYYGSYEQIAKVISKFSANSGLDIVNFYEQVVFSYLTGNSDMHLKNFSLIQDNNFTYNLSHSYDLVNTKIVIPEDKEELALTLNGKKKNINKRDFITSFKNSELNAKQIENIFKKMVDTKGKWLQFISISHLSSHMKSKYENLLNERFLILKLT